MGRQRIIVVGNTCAGKSTLGKELAERLELRFIDLDALHWLPNWQPLPREQFRARVDEATRGSHWVVAGNYLSHQQDISWQRADTVVWLDVPLPVIVTRVFTRSFRRWWTGELLWGTNREQFLPHLKLWDVEASLAAYAVRHHRSRRRALTAAMKEARWQHITFERFRSNREAMTWVTRG